MTAFIGAIFGSTPASLPRPALVRALALRPVKLCRLRDGAVGDYVAMPEPMDLSTGMALVADAVDEVAAAAQPIVLTATPLDQSPGMGEISREARYRPEPDATPVTNTYAYACLLGYGAVDALRAVSILLRATSLPVWAPLVNARAGVESAAQMYWLIEPGVSVEARVQRGMAFRLHNARQQRMAPAEVTAARERARAAIADVRSQAQRLGWSISGRDSKQARVGAEVQPTSKSAIAAVLRYRESTKETEAGVSWWFYSGITHANPFAFMQFVGSDQALPSGMPGLLNAPLYIDGRQLVMATATLGRATINASTAFALLMGAGTTAIEKAERGFSETVLGALGAIERSSSASGLRPEGGRERLSGS